MLHREALESRTLDLLISLSASPALAEFSLVGGTSLALRFGHRRSEDLDWFTTIPFDGEALMTALRQKHHFEPKRLLAHCLAGSLEGVKVDFVLYRYALLEPPEVNEGIRMLSLPDVVAMKLGAIANRGAKKDFYDAHTLIERVGLQQMIHFYQRKFPESDAAIVLRSLVYFEEAESTEEPLSLIGITWPEVKRAVAAAVKRML